MSRLKNFINAHALIVPLLDRCFKFSTIPEIVSELEKEVRLEKRFASAVGSCLLYDTFQNTPFAKKQLEILRVSSPMSLLVTLEQLRKGKTLDFASCFHMEYALAKRLLVRHNFAQSHGTLLTLYGVTERERLYYWCDRKAHQEVRRAPSLVSLIQGALFPAK